MKKIICFVLVLLCLGSTLAAFTSCGGNDEKGFDYDSVEYVETPYAGTDLYVYNWGQNMSDGSDGSVDLIRVFKKMYNINVIFTTYASNEEMYANLSKGGVRYDVIIPSDYMIARLIDEGLVQKIDFSNIPNYKNVEAQYRTGLFYDMGGENGAAEYSVPYTVGMVGIVYNTAKVSEEDAARQSWDLLWDKDYDDKILTFNNSRDAFATATFLLGNSLNSADPADWNAEYDKLIEQRSVLKGYVMDEIFDEMEGGNAYVGTYYAGDCLTMMDENEDLAFYYPVEGTNIFVDAMCVPTCAQNKGAAELFINFLLEKEWAIENSLYICYASPNTEVKNDADYKEALGENSYAYLYEYPESYLNEDGTLNASKVEYYHNLDADTLELLSDLWEKLKAAN